MVDSLASALGLAYLNFILFSSHCGREGDAFTVMLLNSLTSKFPRHPEEAVVAMYSFISLPCLLPSPPDLEGSSISLIKAVLGVVGGHTDLYMTFQFILDL